MNKREIAETLEAIADLLELRGENPFKVRAYRSGARALDQLQEDLGGIIEEERLGKVDGIGKALVEKITELHTSGRLEYFEKLKAEVPAGLVAMLDIPGLGPKKIKKLYDELGVERIEALREACEAGKVSGLEGFGKKTEEKLLSGIRNLEAYNARHLWLLAWQAAEPLLCGLRELSQVERADAAGSLRRCKETVGDLDFLVATEEPQPVVEWFCAQPGIVEVTAKGQTKASVRLEDGLQADLRLVPPERYFFALHHFTGSKDHNVKMRQRALERGYSLSEWGLFKTGGGEPDDGEKSQRKPDIVADSEDALFAALDLSFIEPELREDFGEVEAAEKGGLPHLIDNEDIRGTFHNHTTESDGRNSLEEMVTAAQELGWEYLGIADHSKSSFQANGLDEERLLAQVEQIHRLNASGDFEVHVFAGNEVDILKDGSLDFSDDVLAKLDYAVASVHNAMGMDEAAMTKRIIRALENSHVTMLGHLTGRLLLRRESYEVDIPKVIDAAIANDTFIELNASPLRLDMDWRHWRSAIDKGLKCVINTDAHAVEQLSFYYLGVNAARKGWLQAWQVLNTHPLEDVKSVLLS